MQNNSTTPSSAVTEALRRGQKIEAIKLLRVEAGIGLKDAKERVEQFLEENPDVKMQFSQNAKLSSAGLGVYFVIAAVLAFGFLIFR